MLRRDLDGNCVGSASWLMRYLVILRLLPTNDDSSNFRGSYPVRTRLEKGESEIGPTLNIVSYGASMFDLWLDLDLD